MSGDQDQGEFVDGRPRVGDAVEFIGQGRNLIEKKQLEFLLEIPYTVNTVETAYKVYICPRGNLPYMQIYLITDQKLL